METTDTQSASEPVAPATAADIKRFRSNYQGEVDGVELYRLLARAEKDPARAQIFMDLSETEKGHLKHWADKYGVAMPG